PDSPHWDPVSFDDLLPPTRQPIAWDLNSTQNNVQRPLIIQLARELRLAADNTRIPQHSMGATQPRRSGYRDDRKSPPATETYLRTRRGQVGLGHRGCGQPPSGALSA